jgi:hypothetical protein
LHAFTEFGLNFKRYVIFVAVILKGLTCAPVSKYKLPTTYYITLKDVKCFTQSKECHLKRSVTQLLGLLFPSHPHKMKPPEAVLIYQHCFVLQSLMESVKRVHKYVQEQFEEEFRLVARDLNYRTRSCSRSSSVCISRLIPKYE